MSKEEKIAYGAGIIDGEGCILICKLRSKNTQTLCYHELRVAVGMTNCEVILWLKENFGGHINVWNKKTKGVRKPVSRWTIVGIHARDFLNLLLPYLIVKKQEALVAIEFQNVRQVGKGGNGNFLSLEEFNKREKYKQKLEELKRVVAPLLS